MARRLATAAGVGGLELAPLFESLAPKELVELVDGARRLDPEYEPANFLAWFQVAVPEDADPEALAASIKRLEDVDTAYVLRPGPPPVVNAGDDPRNTNQGYLDAAPNGIDARFAWGFTGADGAGIGWVDLEQGWNLTHEDLAGAGITLIPGINNAYFFHGTSVLGEPAAGAEVDVYWSPPTTLVSPDLWTLIGTGVLTSVPTGSVLVVSDALTWPAAEFPLRDTTAF